jgi:hypothetical protein
MNCSCQGLAMMDGSLESQVQVYSQYTQNVSDDLYTAGTRSHTVPGHASVST